uniref:rolling circle replication-associated protein n=1 Tax=Mariniflexile sp. TaxID=1979402 RepID=UPI00404773E8
MPCFHPITAYQSQDGAVHFHESKRLQSVRTLNLPCRGCRGCRLERSRQWAVRIMHEAALHPANCFITLTYSADTLPENQSLNYRDFQLFFKRLRKHYTGRTLRFYMCGEYGEQFDRPHFHACIFNLDFPDKVFLALTKNGDTLYRSPTLEKLWPHGHSSLGNLTFKSAAYVARYIFKKITGNMAQSFYSQMNPVTGEIYQKTPEFNHMSRRPGIGANWLKKYYSDVYPDAFLVVNGSKQKPPRFYDEALKKVDPDLHHQLQYERHLHAQERYLDNTDARLAVREAVALAQTKTLKRSLS